MKKNIHKIISKLNVFIVLIIVFSLVIGFSSLNYVMADNQATQVASTSQATTITVVGKVADTAVTNITFPQGSPGATISNPYNNVDTISDPQVVAASDSEPVVRLKNTAGATYLVTLEITDWSNGIAASEYYELVDTTTTDVSDVNDVLSSDGNANSVATGISMATDTYKALYLELVLSSLASVTGNSTLTVLGESS